MNVPQIRDLILKHKIYSAIALLLIGGGGYYFLKKPASAGPVTYKTAAVTRSTLISTLSGSGQVSSSNQLDIKAEASGKIIKVSGIAGQQVAQGALIAQLDAKDGLKAVRDAQLNVDSARLSLEKLKQSADNLTLLQAQNNVASAQDALAKLKITQQNNHDDAVQSQQKAQNAIAKAYEDSFNTISNAYLTLPSVMTSLNDALFGTGIATAEPGAGSIGQFNTDILLNTVPNAGATQLRSIKLSAESDYQTARTKYNTNFDHYKSATRYSDNATIESLLAETIDAMKSISQSAQSESNLYGAWADARTIQKMSVYSIVKTYQTTLSTGLSQSNSYLSNLLAIQQTLSDNKNTLVTASRALDQMQITNPQDMAAAEAKVAESQASLDKLISGADPLDLKSQELSLQQRLSALSDAQQNLGNYSARAPIPGVIASVAARVGDTAGSGTVLATIIAQQKLAAITLNEVDVAKVSVGQKATLTFDAVPDLSVAGQVASIDQVGTVSQGVVSYAVKISFDSGDDRVKPGMTVSTKIITNVKQDALTVPSAAVKFDTTGAAYVQTLVNGAPVKHMVTIGISNDSDTEITGGDLKEGDSVVTQIIQPTAATASTASAGASGLQLLGGGGGAAARAFGGAGGGGANRGAAAARTN